MTSPREEPNATNCIVVIETLIDEQILKGRWKFHEVPSFSEICEHDLTRIQPAAVICPLIFGKYDAIDVGRLISNLTPRSILLVAPPRLPRPSMVLSELRNACPQLHIEFLTDQLSRPVFRPS